MLHKPMFVLDPPEICSTDCFGNEDQGSKLVFGVKLEGRTLQAQWPISQRQFCTRQTWQLVFNFHVWMRATGAESV